MSAFGPPPIEITPPGQIFCIYHGTVHAVDDDGKDANAGICQFCWLELHSTTHFSCGLHGIQPRKEGVEGCPVCADPDARKPEVIPPPPAGSFGDTTSEPAKAIQDISEPPPEHRVEEKPIPASARNASKRQSS